jgi:hypothetical protein
MLESCYLCFYWNAEVHYTLLDSLELHFDTDRRVLLFVLLLLSYPFDIYLLLEIHCTIYLCYLIFTYLTPSLSHTCIVLIP